ncbi:MAG TPA: DUF4157 domain-containing protein [Longimicrobium sp.]
MQQALEPVRGRPAVAKAPDRTGRAPSAPPRPGVALARALGNRDYGRLVQPKLVVGPVDDPLEREADRVADAVLSARSLAGGAGDAAPPPPPIQRRAAPGAGGSARAPFPVPAGFESRLAGLGGGEPLPPGVRSFFEPRLGAELGGVRVHSGPAASAAARSIRARAFTVGSDVVFGAGEYAPGTRAGTRLLAHELAHVAQQQLLPAYAGPGAARLAGAPPVVRPMPYGPAVVRRQGEAGAAEEEGMSLSDFGEWILGAIAGEFNPEQSVGQIALDTGLGLIPVVDQAFDIRDILAHLYFMIFEEEYDRPGRWLGVAITLVGLIPEAGTAIRGVVKSLLRGGADALRRVGDLLTLARRLLPDGGDLARLRTFVARHWDEWVAYGVGQWNRAVARMDEVLRAVPDFISGGYRALLARIQALAPRALTDAFARLRAQVTGALDDLVARLRPATPGVPGGGATGRATREAEESAAAEAEQAAARAADDALRLETRGALADAVEGRLGRRAGREIGELMRELIEAIREWARTVFAGFGFRRYEVALEGDDLALYGRRSRILLARIEVGSVQDWVITTTRAIREARHARITQLGRAAASASDALVRLLRGNAVRLSEELGELAAMAVIRARFPSARLLHRGSGSGTLDLIYEAGGNLIVVEAKGGAGRLGTREIRAGLHAQQGTVTYLRDVIASMLNRPGEAAVANRLLAQLNAGRIRYFLTETPVPRGTAPLVTTISEFIVRVT